MVLNITLFPKIKVNIKSPAIIPKIKVNIKSPAISSTNLGNYKFDGDKFFLVNDLYSFSIEPNQNKDGLIFSYKQTNGETVTESMENIIKCYSLLSSEIAEIKKLISSLQLQNIITKDNLSEILKVQIGTKEPISLLNNTIIIPAATEKQFGVVKIAAIDKENGVSADEDSELTVNSLNLDKVVQDENSSLILDSN